MVWENGSACQQREIEYICNRSGLLRAGKALPIQLVRAGHGPSLSRLMKAKNDTIRKYSRTLDC